jgi:hypothetical protein
MPDHTKNKDYYRELSEYYKKRLYFGAAGFYLRNEGNSVANDVNIELKIENRNNTVDIIKEGGLPSRPSEDSIFFRTALGTSFKNINSSIDIKRVGAGYLVNLNFHKAQPKQTIYLDELLYFGSTANSEMNIEYTIFSDNLPEPSKGNLSLNIEVTNKSIHYEELLNG